MAEIQLDTYSFHTTLRRNPICQTNYKSSWWSNISLKLESNIWKVLRNKHNQLDTLHFHYHFIEVQVSTCFGHYLPIMRHYTYASLVTTVCSCRCGCVYYVITSLWCTVNRTLNSYEKYHNCVSTDFHHLSSYNSNTEAGRWCTNLRPTLTNITLNMNEFILTQCAQ
jgi:hypothetical protein